MDAESLNASDMFDSDKRLKLKPVLDFNKLLREAFADGICSCLRCEKGQGDEAAYEYQHTFEIDGKKVNRRFAQTTSSDVLQALKKAWLAYYKTEIDTAQSLDFSQIEVFIEPSQLSRFRPLVLACGLGKEVDNKLELQAVTE